MNRQERLKLVYEHLRKCGMVHTQKAFAEALGKAEGTMSKAFKGDEKALTDNLFVQVADSFPGIFNLDYLLNGTGTLLLLPKEEPDEDVKMVTIYESVEKVNQMLLKSVEEKEAALKDKNRQIERLDEYMRMQRDQFMESLKQRDDEIAVLKDYIADLRMQINQYMAADINKKFPFTPGVAEKKEKKDDKNKKL